MKTSPWAQGKVQPDYFTMKLGSRWGDGANGYTCNYNAGYTGKDCQTNVDDWRTKNRAGTQQGSVYLGFDEVNTESMM